MKRLALTLIGIVLLSMLVGCGLTTISDPSLARASTSVQSAEGISPGTVTLSMGSTQQFTATITGASSSGVTWSTSGGKITPQGLYTAPTAPGSYLVRAIRAAAPSKLFFAIVTVTPISTGAVRISPSSITVTAGTTQQFTAAVTGITNPGVIWSTTGGGINGNGLYVAPSTGGSYTVTATSVSDSTRSASATVTVIGPTSVAVSLSPTSLSLAPGGTQQFTATVTGLANTAVNWTTTGGSITTSGFYTGPSTTGTYAVTATSVADPTKQATASVSIGMPISHSVSLTWNASTSAGIVGYDIYRSTSSGSQYTMLNAQPVTALKYTDSSVQSGETYYYVISAVSSSGALSAYSNEVTAVIPIP